MLTTMVATNPAGILELTERLKRIVARLGEVPACCERAASTEGKIHSIGCTNSNNLTAPVDGGIVQ